MFLINLNCILLNSPPKNNPFVPVVRSVCAHSESTSSSTTTTILVDTNKIQMDTISAEQVGQQLIDFSLDTATQHSFNNNNNNYNSTTGTTTTTTGAPQLVTSDSQDHKGNLMII